MTTGSVTLGVDLAAQPENTAYCAIDWSGPRPAIIEIRCGASDDVLLEQFGRANKVGIDAPFGWPAAFAAAVHEHRHHNTWPRGWRMSLPYRVTDRVVRERVGRPPLSVSSDRIAITAMRCAELLTLAERRYGEQVDRAGGCRFVEVYPAAALKIWGFQSTGYKGSGNRSKRSALVEDLMGATTWLIWNDAAHRCEASDDALDALVASLIARAATVDKVELVPHEEMALAKQEGWIALPEEDSLNGLAVTPSRNPIDAQSDPAGTP